MYGARVPDHRGLFKRGYGSQSYNSGGYGEVWHTSGSLGQVQGDAIRNITGQAGAGPNRHSFFSTWSGALTGANRGGGVNSGDAGGYYRDVRLDASLVVPTANENRPANTAVRYLMRALR
jgi:hypothetical protein